jgi:ABC-type Fe3+ transport system substrate-binding protein
VPARFQARFGLPVEYEGGRGSDLVARMKTEREAGIRTIDVFLGGTGTMAALYREKFVDPLLPVLILPEVVDTSKWKTDRLWFMDPEGKYVLRLFSYLNVLVSINTSLIKPAEIRSFKSLLLDPRLKGKIAAYDPTVPGRGSLSAAFLSTLFGEEFLKLFYIDQKPVLSRDQRQIADWLGRGVYPVTLDVPEQVARLKLEGFPVENLTSLPDAPGSVSAGGGMLALVNGPPHPSAARLFVNWIASKEGLEVYSRSFRNATNRNDVDESFVRNEPPKAGVSYFDADGWDFTGREERARQKLNELFGKRG